VQIRRSRNKDLKNLIDRRNKGLSEVVTTLIILVVAVLLAAVVTYYATNITMTRTQVEEIRFSKEKVWVNYTGAVAAFKIQNLGGRDMLLDRIAFRGVVSDWADVYYYRVPSGIAITGEMNATSYAKLTGDVVELFGRNYTRADTDIPLMSGGVLLIYVRGPDNIQVDDIGTTVAISVFSNNAQYITECNVESATRQ
jgi:flagellin-like protein